MIKNEKKKHISIELTIIIRQIQLVFRFYRPNSIRPPTQEHHLTGDESRTWRWEK